MSDKYEIRPGQSVDLLKALHILTRDGRMNQDSRRKLKQVYHLYGFIEPLLDQVKQKQGGIQLVDVGAGKSYLGFILYDLYFKGLKDASVIHGIEARDELVDKSRALASRLGFGGMRFLRLDAANALETPDLPARIDIVTALHACDTATDDAIRFALDRQAEFVVLVPCCQAEIAALLRVNKGKELSRPVAELWRHPIHTREFGSHVTNVLRCLQLEAHGYQLSVTELVGWEHSMKNELIVARRTGQPARHQAARLHELLGMLGLKEALRDRFFVPN
jgi:SAM-dependent methyltransferase